MLDGAFLRLSSTSLFFCFLLPPILLILVEKEVKDEDGTSLDTATLLSPENLCSWETEYKDNTTR